MSAFGRFSRRAAVASMLVALLVGPIGCAHQRPADAFLRIDQVGFAPGETKIAYLLSPRDAAGAPVTVVDADGDEAWTGTVSPRRGKWNARYPFVEPIDLTALKRTGTYRLKVEGPVTAESPPFRVAAAPALFGPLAANSVQYFEEHRDGAAQRLPAHLTDRQATVYAAPSFAASGQALGPLVAVGEPVDVEGGWY